MFFTLGNVWKLRPISVFESFNHMLHPAFTVMSESRHYQRYVAWFLQGSSKGCSMLWGLRTHQGLGISWDDWLLLSHPKLSKVKYCNRVRQCAAIVKLLACPLQDIAVILSYCWLLVVFLSIMFSILPLLSDWVDSHHTVVTIYVYNVNRYNVIFNLVLYLTYT